MLRSSSGIQTFAFHVSTASSEYWSSFKKRIHVKFIMGTSVLASKTHCGSLRVLHPTHQQQATQLVVVRDSRIPSLGLPRRTSVAFAFAFAFVLEDVQQLLISSKL
ncbi:hypothetical protein VTP01DRAFT_9295 [Rhizomucor pusillus]|uniref:uncharacterized protein n=1 Tax=Rhizomucor pusillus TaxID=4840 RepID=UPI00374233C5